MSTAVSPRLLGRRPFAFHPQANGQSGPCPAGLCAQQHPAILHLRAGCSHLWVQRGQLLLGEAPQTYFTHRDRPGPLIRGRVVTKTARCANRGLRSASLCARRCHRGPHPPGPGSHALGDRPAPPPGPAPSNPLRGRGRGEPQPRLRTAPGEGRVPAPERVGAGVAGAWPGAGRARAGPHWLQRARPPGLSARWRRRRGHLAPRGPSSPGAWTHRRTDGRRDGAQALGRREASRSKGRALRVGRRRPPGRCAGVGRARRGRSGRAAGPQRAAGRGPERSLRRGPAGARASRSGKFATAAALGGLCSSQGGKGGGGRDRGGRRRPAPGGPGNELPASSRRLPSGALLPPVPEPGHGGQHARARRLRKP